MYYTLCHSTEGRKAKWIIECITAVVLLQKYSSYNKQWITVTAYDEVLFITAIELSVDYAIFVDANTTITIELFCNRLTQADPSGCLL